MKPEAETEIESPYIIELRHVTKVFDGNTTVIDDMNLKIRKGEFVAYAGPNGAGKSTTMKLLGGMLLPKTKY